MANKYSVTVGADPEFFVKDKKTDEVIVSCRKFGGEKRAPMFLSPDGGFLEDGTTVEFNVSPSRSLRECAKKLEGLILIFLNKYDNVTFSGETEATFPPDELEKYPEARQIGCAPDLFAYGLRIAPAIEKFKNRRFAGGHIHLGIDPWPEGLEKDLVIKWMDLLFLLPMNAYANKNRWEFYGHPGLYRETPYGVEYRSPDNLWCNQASIASFSKDTRDFLAANLKRFDATLAYVHKCLNIDGHGARVNKEILAIVNSTNLAHSLQGLDFLSGPRHVAHYRNAAGDVQWHAEQSFKERALARAAPKNLEV